MTGTISAKGDTAYGAIMPGSAEHVNGGGMGALGVLLAVGAALGTAARMQGNAQAVIYLVGLAGILVPVLQQTLP